MCIVSFNLRLYRLEINWNLISFFKKISFKYIALCYNNYLRGELMIIDSFLCELKNKYDYNDKLTRALGKILPSMTKYYGYFCATIKI